MAQDYDGIKATYTVTISVHLEDTLDHGAPVLDGKASESFVVASPNDVKAIQSVCLRVSQLATLDAARRLAERTPDVDKLRKDAVL